MKTSIFGIKRQIWQSWSQNSQLLREAENIELRAHIFFDDLFDQTEIFFNQTLPQHCEKLKHLLKTLELLLASLESSSWVISFRFRWTLWCSFPFVRSLSSFPQQIWSDIRLYVYSLMQTKNSVPCTIGPTCISSSPNISDKNTCYTLWLKIYKREQMRDIQAYMWQLETQIKFRKSKTRVL